MRYKSRIRYIDECMDALDCHSGARKCECAEERTAIRLENENPPNSLGESTAYDELFEQCLK